MEEYVLFSAGYILWAVVLWEVRGVILQGHGWCYGMAFTATDITGLYRHCFATLGVKNFPNELYTLDIEVDIRSPSRRKWLEKMRSTKANWC